MSLFVRKRDVRFFDGLNRELIDHVIDTICDVFKLSLVDTETNLYGEALKKIYFPSVRAAALIDNSDQDWDYEEFGPDVIQEVTFAFHRNTLEGIDLIPEVGDVIEWNNGFFEINALIENQLLGGQPEFSHSIICRTHQTKRGRILIEKIRAGIAENPGIIENL